MFFSFSQKWNAKAIKAHSRALHPWALNHGSLPKRSRHSKGLGHFESANSGKAGPLTLIELSGNQPLVSRFRIQQQTRRISANPLAIMRLSKIAPSHYPNLTNLVAGASRVVRVGSEYGSRFHELQSQIPCRPTVFGGLRKYHLSMTQTPRVGS